jgi:hypothetical protein
LHTALGGPFTKKQLFRPLRAPEKWEMHFYVETEKKLVAKVVGNAKMHISTKTGPWFHSLLLNLHKPWSPCKEEQENSCLEAPLCERVHM